MWSVLHGDCLDLLRGVSVTHANPFHHIEYLEVPDGGFHAVICDPPYGLGTREPTVTEILAYLSGESVLDTGGDFMGHDWQIPSVAVWKECFRVLRPGGHLLVFAGTRTMDLISVGIRAAGFGNRDTIASEFGVTCLQWVTGQGFPKSTNVKKAMLKAGVDPEIAAKHEGLGTALKPSWEPILVFRKPIEEKTVAEQVLKTGTGGLNIDACRVGLAGIEDHTTAGPAIIGTEGSAIYGKGAAGVNQIQQARLDMGLNPRYDSKGRWPANIIFTHAEGCKIIGHKKVPAPVINRFTDGMKPFGEGAGHSFESEQMGDENGMEEVPVYECVEGCPSKKLDEQGGGLKSGEVKPHHMRNNSEQVSRGGYGGGYGDSSLMGYGDKGGASRFFGQFQPDAPFFYCAKASKSERNKGLGAGGNTHSTVKPLALMRWLIRLVTPKGGTILDPFGGSGTTAVAACQEGRDVVVIEREWKWVEVAKKRIAQAAVEVGEATVEDAEEIGGAVQLGLFGERG